MQILKRLAVAVLSLSIVMPSQAASTLWSMGYWAGFGSDPLTSLQWNAITHLITQIVWPSSAADGTLTFEDQAGSLSSGQTTFAPFAESIISTAHANGVKVVLGLNVSTGAGWVGATSSAHLNAFVNNLMSVVNTYGFDGIDIDWESGINYTQMSNLLTSLRSSLGAKVLTATMSDGNISFWVGQASKLDRIGLQTYDFACCDSFAWFNSPLYTDSGDNGISHARSVDSLTKEFTKAGFPAAKINIGIPFYGVTISATAPRQTAFSFNGNQEYNKLAPKYNLGNATWDAPTHEPWLPYSGGYVSFENAQSLTDKVNYAKTSGVGGWIIFDLDGDYLASQTPKHPLMAAVAAAIGGSTTPPPQSCDINGDGTTNVSDVQACVNQALGVTTCSSCNLTNANPAACSAVDVQRDVNAALGGQCVVGQ